MAVTILEALQNARINLSADTSPFQNGIGRAQLNNAIGLLEKGYDIHDEVEPLLGKYGNVDKVPEKPTPTV